LPTQTLTVGDHDSAAAGVGLTMFFPHPSNHPPWLSVEPLSLGLPKKASPLVDATPAAPRAAPSTAAPPSVQAPPAPSSSSPLTAFGPKLALVPPRALPEEKEGQCGGTTLLGAYMMGAVGGILITVILLPLACFCLLHNGGASGATESLMQLAGQSGKQAQMNLQGPHQVHGTESINRALELSPSYGQAAGAGGASLAGRGPFAAAEAGVGGFEAFSGRRVAPSSSEQRGGYVLLEGEQASAQAMAEERGDGERAGRPTAEARTAWLPGGIAGTLQGWSGGGQGLADTLQGWTGGSSRPASPGGVPQAPSPLQQRGARAGGSL